MILVVCWFEIQVIRLSIDVFQMIWQSVDVSLKWGGCQLIWDSSDSVVNWSEIQALWLSIKLGFKWFGCQSIRDSSELVVNWFEIQMIWLSMDVWFDWFCFEIQVSWLSIDLRLEWFGCQSLWDSNELVVSRFEMQMSWLSIDLRFQWFGRQMIWVSIDLVVNSCVIQMILPNEAFLQDFLQNWSFEVQKRSFSARLPSKIKLWSSKTKLFCETSFKNEALEIKNEAFLRDFLQDWSFEAQKRSFSARLPSQMNLWRSKTKHFCETSFKNDNLTRHLTSEFQYVLTIFNWTLQKYCACHEKVEPGHTKSCNCHAKWPLQSNASGHEICNLSTVSASEASNIDIAKREIIALATRNASFRSLFKSTTPANVFATLTNSCACHVFCNVSKSLRLPRETHFEPQKTPETDSF